MIALSDLGADVDWTDAGAAAAARRAVAGRGMGRLGELAEWLAATQGRWPPDVPQRVRCLAVRELDPRVAELAANLDVGVRTLDTHSGLAGGAAAADDEAESGCDLVVLVAPEASAGAAAAVALCTDAEPVAVLPRGGAAVDTTAWIERARTVRDLRRAALALRDRPDELLAALDDVALAAAVGFVLQAAVRRTALVLDGAGALAAALLAAEVQPRAARWWQLADSSPDPVHARAAQQLGRPVLLDLDTAGDGTAGLLAVPLLRAAAAMAGSDG